jgi:poly-gamma-glutamate synthesis protein (capsule biosynthesis protein)
MYFPALDVDTGQLLGLELVPTQTTRFRVRRTSESDGGWLCSTLDRESRRFATSAILRAGQRIVFDW